MSNKLGWEDSLKVTHYLNLNVTIRLLESGIGRLPLQVALNKLYPLVVRRNFLAFWAFLKTPHAYDVEEWLRAFWSLMVGPATLSQSFVFLSNIVQFPVSSDVALSKASGTTLTFYVLPHPVVHLVQLYFLSLQDIKGPFLVHLNYGIPLFRLVWCKQDS